MKNKQNARLEKLERKQQGNPYTVVYLDEGVYSLSDDTVITEGEFHELEETRPVILVRYVDIEIPTQLSG